MDPSLRSRRAWFALIFGLLLVAAVSLRPLGTGPRVLNDRPVDYWIAQLDLPPQHRDPATTHALASAPDVAIPHLCRRLTETDGVLRTALLKLAQAWPEIPVRVASTDIRRQEAAEIIPALGDRALACLPSLVQALALAHRPSAVDAVREALVALGHPAIEPLLQLVEAGNPETRLRSLDTLRRILSTPPSSEKLRSQVAAIAARQLSQARADLVLSATRILRLFPVEGIAGLPDLARHLHLHPSSEIRAASAEVLGVLNAQPARCVPALASALRDPVPAVRTAAAFALGKYGQAAGSAAKALESAAVEGPASVSVAALHALRRVGPTATETVGGIAACLQHPRSVVRAVAALALGRVEDASGTAVRALTHALEDEDSDVRGNAGWALGQYGRAAAPAVGALMKALGDPAESVRVQAAEALGKMGPAAREAEARLKAARSNNPSIMSGPVDTALVRIRATEESGSGAGVPGEGRFDMPE